MACLQTWKGYVEIDLAVARGWLLEEAPHSTTWIGKSSIWEVTFSVTATKLNGYFITVLDGVQI